MLSQLLVTYQRLLTLCRVRRGILLHNFIQLPVGVFLILIALVFSLFSGIVLAALTMSLPSYLIHLPLAEQLGILDQLEAELAALLPEDQGVSVLVQLTHDGADLEVQLALVAERLHLLS